MSRIKPSGTGGATNLLAANMSLTDAQLTQNLYLEVL